MMFFLYKLVDHFFFEFCIFGSYFFHKKEMIHRFMFTIKTEKRNFQT